MTLNPFGTEWQRPGSPSSATDDRGQGRQIYIWPQPITLVRFRGEAEGNEDSVQFRVDIPDSRLRCKISIIGNPLEGNAPDFLGSKNLTLWLRAIDDAIQGGGAIPITNLWGSAGTPGAIPGELDNTGTIVRVTTLGGFSKEFETAGDAIMGTVAIGATVDAGPGLLQLQVRWAPAAGIRFPRDEWAEIRGQCSAALVGNAALNEG